VVSLSVLVVDDQPVIRTVLGALIEADDRLCLFGDAENGRQAIDRARPCCPDLIVCDVEMPIVDGLAAVPLLRHQCPDAVIATYSSDPAAAGAALHQGADRVFDKTTDVTAMLDDLVVLAQERRA
jgi:two-component system, LuxR family, secretion system response regulator SsrB